MDSTASLRFLFVRGSSETGSVCEHMAPCPSLEAFVCDTMRWRGIVLETVVRALTKPAVRCPVTMLSA